MTKEEWMQLAKKMKGVYQREEKFLPDVETVNQWYEFMNDLEYDRTATAVDGYIREEKFAPTVADIRSRYEDLVDAEKKEQGAIKTNYDYARGSYPQSIEAGYAWEEWKARAKDGEMASLFYKVIMQYVSECDKKNEDVMDFKKCVETICRDNDGKIFFKEAK